MKEFYTHMKQGTNKFFHHKLKTLSISIKRVGCSLKMKAAKGGI
jgi:hypothetical protein